jgi:hypothetical protein
MNLTSNNIAEEPCEIVVKYPVQKREQAAEVALECCERRCELGQPLSSGRLALDVGVDRGHRSCARVLQRIGLLAVVNIDTKDLGYAPPS